MVAQLTCPILSCNALIPANLDIGLIKPMRSFAKLTNAIVIRLRCLLLQFRIYGASCIPLWHMYHASPSAATQVADLLTRLAASRLPQVVSTLHESVPCSPCCLDQPMVQQRSAAEFLLQIGSARSRSDIKTTICRALLPLLCVGLLESASRGVSL